MAAGRGKGGGHDSSRLLRLQLLGMHGGPCGALPLAVALLDPDVVLTPRWGMDALFGLASWLAGQGLIHLWELKG